VLTTVTEQQPDRLKTSDTKLYALLAGMASDDAEFVSDLDRAYNVIVLPGQSLAQRIRWHQPGKAFRPRRL